MKFDEKKIKIQILSFNSIISSGILGEKSLPNLLL